MHKKLVGMLAGVAMAGAWSYASAQADPTWAWRNFEDPKLLTVHFTCDAGTSEFKSYMDTPQTFTGITIKWKGGTFFVYSPNPDSMSPITYTYVKKVGGLLRSEVARHERDRIIRAEAPQLYEAMSAGSTESCKIILDGSQRKSK